MKRSLCLLVLLGLFASCALASPLKPSELYRRQLHLLQARSKGAAQVARGPNGAVFLSFSESSDQMVAPKNEFASLVRGTPSTRASSEAQAHDFVRAFTMEYHSLLGFVSAKQVQEQLSLRSVHIDRELGSHSHVVMEQRFKGVRVFGGELRFHLKHTSRVAAINGLIVSEVNERTVSTTEPSVSFEEASQIAIRAVSSKYRSQHPKNGEIQKFLTVQQPKSGSISEFLLIFHRDVLAYRPENMPPRLVWDIRVSASGVPIHDQVLVDALSGAVVNHISLIRNALNRRMFQYTNEPHNLIWAEGDPIDPEFPAIDDLVNVLNGTRSAYKLYETAFDWISYDNNDSRIDSIIEVSPCKSNNAWWDGSKMNYCRGVTALDVIVHEISHAVTTYTDDLYYQFQSGALNEAYSDIFGETAQILAGDPLRQVPRTTGSCSQYGEGANKTDASKRWLIAEDLDWFLFFSNGLRDMWRPECYNLPGEVSKEVYHCSSDDGYGVHINSGVINHAYALAVDGGDFRGFHIEGVGLNKALAVWWRAKRYYQTETTNFVDHAHALRQACSDLIGSFVRNLTTGENETHEIKSHDCEQISYAINAVNMTSDVAAICDFVSFSDAQPDPCQQGTSDIIFSEKFQDDPFSRGWTKVTSNPIPDIKIGWTWGCEQGLCLVLAPSMPLLEQCPWEMPLNILTSPSIVAETEGPYILSFKFAIGTSENNGGMVKLAVNNTTRSFLEEDFILNGYNRIYGNGSFWSGPTGASYKDFELHLKDRFVQTQITVDNIQKGDVLQLGFMSGCDMCHGLGGFAVTNITLTKCTTVSAASASLPSSVLLLLGALVVFFLVL